MSKFVKEVRKGKIAQPTQKSFTLEKWRNSFRKISDPSQKDKNLYKTGKWVFGKFENIRKKLNKYKVADVSRESFLRLLIATSNKVSHTLAYSNLPDPENKFVFIEETLQATVGRKINSSNPDATPDMILTSSVDSLRFPLAQALQYKGRHDSNKVYKETLINIKAATVLGQIYDIVDGYWMQSLWNNWYVDFVEDLDILTPPKSDEPIITAISEYRRQAISLEVTLHISRSWYNANDELKNQILSTVPQVSIKGLGKKKRYKIYSRNKDDTRSSVLVKNRLRADRGYYQPFFDVELPNLKQVTINDLLRVWEVLYALATAQLELVKLPENENESEEIENLDDLLKYAPTLYFNQIVRMIKDWINFSTSKIIRILNFFIYKNHLSDLWANPIIKINDKKFVFLWSSLIYGNIERIVEIWMEKGGFDFTESGYLYEKHCRQELIQSLQSSEKLVNDCEVYPTNFNLVIENKKEEIDLIIKIGKTILVGEIKSVLFPTEPLEKYRYFEILKGASEQVQRKLLFIKSHKEKFFENVNFSSDVDATNCNFFPFVLVNQPFGSGFKFNNVPVVDVFLIKKFFDGKWERIAIIDSKGKTDSLHKTYFYESEEQASEVVFQYLLNPPQLLHYAENLEAKINCLPIINEGDSPICMKTIQVSLPFPKIEYEMKKDFWI